MKQIKRAIYGVTAGEVVAVEVEATKTGNFVHLYLNSSVVPPSSLSPLNFQFSCLGAVNGTDYAVVRCHFSNDAPDDAEYQLYLTGNAGGGRFEGSDITKASAVWDRDITFITT